jgi:prepilin-type N-terminal cleavage/methylation domain-containing protein/prepilin-type processing-associated H-X9-DG protein
MRRSDHARSCACSTGLNEQVAVRFRGGFSLIEMLVTLAILIILTTLYWGPNSASRQRSLKSTCARNLSKLYVAMDIYATEHGAKFPEVPGARTSEEALVPLVPRYTSDTSLFICPGSKDSAPPADTFQQGRISYAYYMGQPTNGTRPLMSDRQVDTTSKSPGQLAFSFNGKPPGNNHRKFGGNFLFADGRVESTPAKLPFAAGLTPGLVLLNPK